MCGINSSIIYQKNNSAKYQGEISYRIQIGAHKRSFMAEKKQNVSAQTTQKIVEHMGEFTGEEAGAVSHRETKEMSTVPQESTGKHTVYASA